MEPLEKENTTMRSVQKARMELLNMLEELGSAATLLREAEGNLKVGNEMGASMCLEDVIEIMDVIEVKSDLIVDMLHPLKIHITE